LEKKNDEGAGPGHPTTAPKNGVKCPPKLEKGKSWKRKGKPVCQSSRVQCARQGFVKGREGTMRPVEDLKFGKRDITP